MMSDVHVLDLTPSLPPRASKKLADENGKAFKYILEQGEKSKLPQSFLDDAARKGVEIIEVAFTP